MQETDVRISQAVRQIVTHLVAGEYELLAEKFGESRLSAEEIRYAVAKYGRKLTTPPDAAFDALDIIQLTGSIPRQWSVRFDLWTIEEGRSDLTLETTLIESHAAKALSVQIDDIHVL